MPHVIYQKFQKLNKPERIILTHIEHNRSIDYKKGLKLGKEMKVDFAYDGMKVEI